MHSGARRSAGRLVAMTAMLLVMQLVMSACFGQGSKRSVQAFCGTFKEEAIALHAKYESADQSIQNGGTAGTLTGILTLVQSSGDMVVMFDALDKTAPDEIEPSVAEVLDALKQLQDNNKGALSNPLGTLGSGLIVAMESGGAYTNVDQYITEHCDLSFEH